MNIRTKYKTIYEAIIEIFDISVDGKKWNRYRQQISRKFFEEFHVKPKFWKELSNTDLNEFIFVTIKKYLKKQNHVFTDIARENMDQNTQELLKKVDTIERINTLRNGAKEDFYDKNATEDEQRVNYYKFVRSYKYAFSTTEHMPTYEEWTRDPLRVIDYYYDNPPSEPIKKNNTFKIQPVEGVDYFLELNTEDDVPDFTPSKVEVIEVALQALAKKLNYKIDYESITKALEAKNIDEENPFEGFRTEIDPNSPVPIEEQKDEIIGGNEMVRLLGRLERLDFILRL